jgi:hypothetical protein
LPALQDRSKKRSPAISMPTTTWGAHGRTCRVASRSASQTSSSPSSSKRHPDIYLRIFDATGSSELHHTQDAVRWNVGAVERLDVAVPRARLA